MSDSDTETKKKYISECVENAKQQAQKVARAKAAALEPFTIKDEEGNVRTMEDPEVRRWVMSEKPEVYKQWLHTLEVASKIERERKQQKVRDAVAEERQKFLETVEKREKKANKAISMSTVMNKQRQKTMATIRDTRIKKVAKNQEHRKKQKNQDQEKMISNTSHKLDKAAYIRLQEENRRQEAGKNHWNDIVTVVQERKRILSAQRREKIEKMVLGDKENEERIQQKKERKMRRRERRRRRKERRLKKNLTAIEQENEKLGVAIRESQGYGGKNNGGGDSSMTEAEKRKKREQEEHHFLEDEENEEEEEDSDFDDLSSSDDSLDDMIKGKVIPKKEKSQTPSEQNHQLDEAFLPTSPAIVLPSGVHRKSRIDLLIKLKRHLVKMAIFDKKQQKYHSYNMAGALQDVSEKELQKLASHRLDTNNTNSLQRQGSISGNVINNNKKKKDSITSAAPARRLPIFNAKKDSDDEADEEAQEIQTRFHILFEQVPDRVRKMYMEQVDEKNETLERMLHIMTNRTGIDVINELTIHENVEAADLDDFEKIDTRLLELIFTTNAKKLLLKFREEKDKSAECAYVELENRKAQKEHEKSRFARPWETMKGNPVDYIVLTKKQEIALRKQKQEEQKKRQQEAFDRHLKVVDEFRKQTLREQTKRIEVADHRRDGEIDKTVRKLRKHHREENRLREKYYDRELEKQHERFLTRQQKTFGTGGSKFASNNHDNVFDGDDEKTDIEKRNAAIISVSERLYSSPARKSRLELIQKLKAHNAKVMSIEKQRHVYRQYTLAGTTRTMSLQQLTELAHRKREMMDEERFRTLEELPEKLRQSHDEHVERRQAFLERVVDATKGMRYHDPDVAHREYHQTNASNKFFSTNNNDENIISGRQSSTTSSHHQQQPGREKSDLSQKAAANNNDDDELDENHFLNHISATDLEELEKLDPRLLDAMLGENMKKQYIRMKEERDRAAEAAEKEAEDRKNREEEQKANLDRPWETMNGNPVGYRVLTREEILERKKQAEEEHRIRQEEAYRRHVEQVQEFRVKTHEDQLKRVKQADKMRDGYQVHTVARLKTQREHKETVHERAVFAFNQKKIEQLEEFEDIIRRPSFITLAPVVRRSNEDDDHNNTDAGQSHHSNSKTNNNSSCIETPKLTPPSSSTNVEESSSSKPKMFFPPLNNNSNTNTEKKEDSSSTNNNKDKLSLSNSAIKYAAIEPRYLQKPKRFDDPEEAKAYFEEQDRKHQKKLITAHHQYSPHPPSSAHQTSQNNNIDKTNTNNKSSTNDERQSLTARSSSSKQHQYEKSLATAEERRQQVLDKLNDAEQRRKAWARQRDAYMEQKRVRSVRKEEQREQHVERMYDELATKRNAITSQLEEDMRTAEERRLDALEEKAYRAKSYMDHHEELQQHHGQSQHHQSADRNASSVVVTPSTAREKNKSEKPKFFVEKGSVSGIF